MDTSENLIEQVMYATKLDSKICEKYLIKNNLDVNMTICQLYDKIKNGQIEVLDICNYQNVKSNIDVDDFSKITGAEAAGTVYGNVSNASTIYGMDKFNTPRGHGFAAERANHLYDKLHGKNAQIVGDNNVKNGADRIVDGVNIQTKFCSSGSKCISECFENGKLKYLNPDGTPMKIEVPADKYEAAVQAMENRIKDGQVPGVKDPEKAKDLVKKSPFKYEQVKNIAKFGTVESITYDAMNGAIVSTSAMGISAVMTFATSIWNGEDFDVALQESVYVGLKVGGTTFITSVLTSQLARTGLNSALVESSEAIVKLMGSKSAAYIANAMRSGTNIYGNAAIKNVAKMLRSNVITSAVSIVVLSSVDIANIFSGKISGAQLFKNVATTASSVGGGTAGWIAGTAVGTTIGTVIGSIIPGAGTIAGAALGAKLGSTLGGLAGSFAGGAAAGKVSGAVLDQFIEDDANKMIAIIQETFVQLAEDYLLNKNEAENITDKLKEKLTGKLLKDMFSSSNRSTFAKNLLEPLIEDEVKLRKKIKIPSDAEFTIGLRRVLEKIVSDTDDHLANQNTRLAFD